MSGRAERGVEERVFITGTLTLETPAHFGSGDAEGLTDMPLLRDSLKGKRPLLTGTSIAGALRNYLREYEHGYNATEIEGDLAGRLFGRIEEKKEEKASHQSWLLVDDALGHSPGIELRDGVAIDPKTRTAAENKKFDVELLQAGTTFPLSFELLLTKDNQDLLDALALALHGLERSEIGLGYRKRRGLGQCRAGEWRVRRYRVTTPKGLIAWLDDDRGDKLTGDEILKLLKVSPSLPDRRESFSIEATFKLTGSLLIRSGSGKADAPDMVHLRSYRDGADRPILSGTSLAGAVRARALRVANTVLPQGRADLVDDMFGKRIGGRGDKPSGSRVITHESVLQGARDLVQSRVKIDRFTGGAFHTALFTQQPAFGGDGASVTLDLTLRRPGDHEIGLLLLVLKDLWTGDLPLGGESSVGRGRLEGQSAALVYRHGNRVKEWQLAQRDGRLEITGRQDELEAYVQALHEYRRAA